MQREIPTFHRYLRLAAVALLAVAGSGPLQADEFESTLRVLDDPADVRAVLADAVAKIPAGERRPERRSRASDSNDGTAPSRGKIDLDTELDREQESESELEDRDVPEDIDFDLSN